MVKKFLGCAVALTLSVVTLCTVPALASSTVSKNVTVEIGDKVIGTYSTTSDTVASFLHERNVTLADSQTVVNNLDDKIADNTIIKIDSGVNVNLTVDNKKVIKEVKSGTTIGALIKELTMETGVDYYYVDGSNTDVITNDKQINLLSRKEETFTKNETVPFKTIYKDTTSMVSGVEKIQTSGVNGEKTTVVQVVFYGGQEYLKKTISENVTKQPVDQVISRGVAKSVKTDTGAIKYSKVFTMSASAYTAGPESTGKRPGDHGYGKTATGMNVRHGVVAVDPKIIPLGTHLYVEGYGNAIAADTGSAIKGSKIDLFYFSLHDAVSFGRRNVKVYVLNS